MIHETSTRHEAKDNNENIGDLQIIVYSYSFVCKHPHKNPETRQAMH